ncbi:MAG: RNase III inhibitor [Clostridiales bacterium]|nr:RNase III inhibitor [Clostridiales bacterium]
MPIQIIRNDISRMHVDAIVTTCDNRLRVTGGVNAAIHKAAGPLLEQACRRLGGCATGEVKVTPGFDLPCRYVLHTVSPVWHGDPHEYALLAACYRRSLETAVQLGCGSIAFPLIASGNHGCPNPQALRIATQAISDFLLLHVPDNDLMVYLVTFTRESFLAGSQLFSNVRQYIDECYVEEHYNALRELRRSQQADACLWPGELYNRPPEPMPQMYQRDELCAPCPAEEWDPASLKEALNHVDESFSQMLVRLISERGIKNSDCYKRANIDKKLFSKIITNPHHKPRKNNVLALAIALELPLDETRELLMKAGLALSHSEKFDIAVEYFIRNRFYDIMRINEILYELDLPLLGGTLL